MTMVSGEDEQPFVITNDETGRTFTFASEDVWAEAQQWYQTTSKAEIIDYCAKQGIDLLESTDNPAFEAGVKLLDDWAEIATELWAKNR